MSKKEKQNETPQQEPAVEEQDVKREAAAEPEETAVDPLLSELESLKDQVAGQEDKYLRLAAEYDNYRKRTAKEKESLWTDVKADTAGAFLPVYDNLERALKQDTADEAFKKGVEKARNLMIVMWLALFGGFYLLAKLVPTAAMARTLTERLDSIPAGYAAVLGGIGGVVLVAAALWGSYRFSCKIYAQQEF